MNVSDANIQSGFEYILQLRQIPLRILLGLGHDHRVSVRNSSEAINTLYYRISSLISIIPIPVLIFDCTHPRAVVLFAHTVRKPLRNIAPFRIERFRILASPASP